MAKTSTGPRIFAFVVLTADAQDPDRVVGCAAELLRKELRATDVTLDYLDASGRRRGILISGMRD